MRKLSLFFACVLFVQLVYPQNNSKNDADSVVVFLVRHAEKTDNSQDPELSESGKERAQVLAETLIDSKIEYIYSTNFKRTLNTAAPLANLPGKKVVIYDPNNLPELAEKNKQIS